MSQLLTEEDTSGQHRPQSSQRPSWKTRAFLWLLRIIGIVDFMLELAESIIQEQFIPAVNEAVEATSIASRADTLQMMIEAIGEETASLRDECRRSEKEFRVQLGVIRKAQMGAAQHDETRQWQAERDATMNAHREALRKTSTDVSALHHFLDSELIAAAKRLVAVENAVSLLVAAARREP